jgi:NADH dehydrogenase [ubiquinone] 1 alpha subcomplex assembly factor 7
VPDATWHDRFDALPAGPLFLIANEFFDALPVRQLVKTDRGWCERYVMLDEDSTEDEPHLVPALAPVPLPSDALIPRAVRNAAPGSLVEISPASRAIVEDIANRLRDRGGAALIVDYGHAKSAAGDTLQALRAHKFTDPFETPGEADLTAHVDFEALADAARAGGATPHGPVEQGAFLKELGIGERAATLKRHATPEQARDVDLAERRLTSREEMGSLFKVLALTAPGTPTPPGF